MKIVSGDERIRNSVGRVGFGLTLKVGRVGQAQRFECIGRLDKRTGVGVQVEIRAVLEWRRAEDASRHDKFAPPLSRRP